MHAEKKKLNTLNGHVLRPSWIEADLDAIRHNFHQLKTVLGNTQLLAVVKADAYGLGAVQVSRFLQQLGADRLGVVCLEEAMQLRTAGVTLPVLNMGAILPEQAETACALDIEQMVYRPEVARALSRCAQARSKKMNIHFKIDTGMSRYGARFDAALPVFEQIAALPGIDIIGVMSHFANSDGLDKAFPLLQCARFLQVRDQIESTGIRIPLWHICNSGATLDLPQAHFDMVRVGLLLYGYYPSGEVVRPFTLQPALRLKSTLVAERQLSRGDSVGYGRRYMATGPERIGVLPLGYADGFDRKQRNNGHVLWQGRRLPIVGGLCMDACFVRLDKEIDAHTGDVVTVLGREGDEEITPHDIAERIGSVSYEVMARLGKRLPRITVKDKKVISREDSFQV